MVEDVVEDVVEDGGVFWFEVEVGDEVVVGVEVEVGDEVEVVGVAGDVVEDEVEVGVTK